MNILDRLDPEQTPILDRIAKEQLDLTDIPGTRARLKQQKDLERASLTLPPDITITDQRIPGGDGETDITVRIYRPQAQSEILPGILYIHGGGYILGTLDDGDELACSWARDVRCVVVSVDYRLAPEHPFPTPLEDCYTALKWFSQNAGQLGADPKRIAIAGGSAGGGLAAGLALLARDRGEVSVCFQLLAYPMIDDRGCTPSSQNHDIPGWTVENNRIGWKSYLGEQAGGQDVSPYAAAARATDLKGLPPAYIFVGELDLFLDEDIEYAQRLLQAGVPTELHVYPGSLHAFDIAAPEATMARRAQAEQVAVLKKALHGS